MSAYIGASPASRRFQSLKELTGSPTCRQKACWESPLWACSSTQACHCEAGWREWRRFDMGTDAPSVNDGISVGGQAISRNDAPGWPLTTQRLAEVAGNGLLQVGLLLAVIAVVVLVAQRAPLAQVQGVGGDLVAALQVVDHQPVADFSDTDKAL